MLDEYTREAMKEIALSDVLNTYEGVCRNIVRCVVLTGAAIDWLGQVLVLYLLFCTVTKVQRVLK